MGQVIKHREVDMKREVFFISVIFLLLYMYLSFIKNDFIAFIEVKNFIINNKIDMMVYMFWIVSLFSILSLVVSKVINKHVKMTLIMEIIIQLLTAFLLIDINIEYNINVFSSHVPVLLAIILITMNIRTLIDVSIYFSKRIKHA